MENLLMYSFLLLASFVIVFATIGKTWGSNVKEFLFANRSLQLVPSGLAIGSHWIWAIALFVGPATAYNWGYLGAAWFLIPNTLTLVLAGYIITKVRDKYPDGFSLTTYVKENFSTRIGALYQFEFVVTALAALLLAFTAIAKLWGFSGLTDTIQPIYASLAVGVLTMLFTIKGGIRTSIFTGATQAVLWLIFIVMAIVALASSDLSFITNGKNQLETLFHTGFLTNFGIAYLIAISVSSVSHGHLWQKGFSMPKNQVLPAFTIGAVFFGIFLAVILALAMFAQANGLEVKGPDTSLLVAITTLLGGAALLYFSVIFIGQTSTVIDSAMNYFSSLVTLEWLKSDSVWTTRIIMVAFLLVAWIISWLKLDIWTIMLLMSSVRTVMFIPLIFDVFNVRLNEKLMFWTCSVGIIVTVYFAATAKINSIPINNMYAMLAAIGIPLTVFLISKFVSKTNDTKEIVA